MTTPAEIALARLATAGIHVRHLGNGQLQTRGPATDRHRQVLKLLRDDIAGWLATQDAHESGEPAEWCHRCGHTVHAYSPDGQAWCEHHWAIHTAIEERNTTPNETNETTSQDKTE